MEFITADEKQLLEDKLKNMKAKRTVLSKRIAAARALGDLSENAEYHAARDDQGLNEAEIRRIEQRLKDIKVADQSAIPKDVVFVGSRVKLRDTEDDSEEIVFSRRNQNTLTNKLTLNHTFTKNAYLKFILRHYWSTINNKSFYSIREDGYLDSYYTDPQIDDEHNINFNSWNIDLNFSWEYRPGSFLSLVWQNQIANETNEIENLFLNNINDLFENPSTNIFSVKFTYYLDIANYSKK